MDHSKNFNKVKQYYDLKLWSLAKVKSAVGKWITESEYIEITGMEYKGDDLRKEVQTNAG